MGNNTTKKPKKKVTKKKVIKVGVGKPFIRGGKTYTTPRGTTDRTGKLKTIHNLIDTVFKQYTDKKITAKKRDKMVDAAINAMKTQIKNKTYFK
jgi:hypothetical protein